MNDRFRKLFALVLILAGLGCVIYAVSVWRDTEVTESGAAQPAEPHINHEVTPPAPGTQTEPDDATGHDKTREEAAPVGGLRHTPDDPAKPGARNRAVTMWIAIALPLAFVGLVVMLLLHRWLRPAPLKRTGPTDTTDPWQEAGKRFRLE